MLADLPRWQLLALLSASVAAGVAVRCSRNSRPSWSSKNEKRKGLKRSQKRWRKLTVLICDSSKEAPDSSKSGKIRPADLTAAEDDQPTVQLLPCAGTDEHHLIRARYRCTILGPYGLLFAAPLNAGRVLQFDPETEVAREIGPDIQGMQKYLAMMSAENGLLLAAPFNAGRVLQLDPVTEVVQEIGPKLPGLAKYACLASEPLGCLYAAPLNASRVLQIDPGREAVQEIGPEILGPKKYYSIALGADKLLYAAPFNAGRVLRIDSRHEVVEEIGPSLPGSKKYYCMAAAQNGLLFAAPYDALHVLQIDPRTGSVQEIGPELPGSKKYHCMTVASNGLIYAAPFDAARVLQIDPETGQVEQVGPEMLGSEKYGSMAVTPNGFLYAASWNASRTLEIDPYSQEVKEIGPEMQGLMKYGCMAAASNGSLYAFPCNASRALQINVLAENGKTCSPKAIGHSKSTNLHNATLLELGTYADVHIVIGARSFTAHRAILARIPFFRAAFDHAEDPSCIEVGGTSARAVEQILQVVYTGQTHFLEDVVDLPLLQELLELAERFELLRLKVQVAQRLTEFIAEPRVLNPETVGCHLAFARLYKLPSIQRLCIAYARKHAAEVMLAPETHNMFHSNPEVYEELVHAATGRRR